MNPFAENPRKLEDTFLDWSRLYVQPYDKHSVDPYTRTRVILMNGTEFEANWFSHQFSRHCGDNELRRQLARIRRGEQQQQKLVSMLKPADETVLEHTIGYEQLAVDLTAALAQMVGDEYVKRALDFALLEDFDHLYRYADLLLTLAEAANELGGAHTREAVGYVNEVLFRARNASNEQRTEPADWDAGLSQEEIRAALRVERRCELKGELHEWFDSRRFGVAYLTGLIDIHNARIAETASLSPYDYVLPNGFNEVKKNLLLPFPNAEISANYNISASDQNFGY